MKLGELLALSDEDKRKAKELADEMTSAINRYNIKPILLESILSLQLNDVRKHINDLIEQNKNET